MYIVVYSATGSADYYLRGTILTSDKTRAQSYPTKEAASQGIVKATPFHKARVIKALAVQAVCGHCGSSYDASQGSCGCFDNNSQ